jgi:uncharacterized membrane protein
MNNLIWSFSPWVAFLLGVRIGGVYWGAAIGLVLAAVVLVRAIRRKHLHLFDVIGAVYFGGLLALLAVLHPADISTWGRYAQAVAHGSLTLIVFGSILIGKPFTEAYAREQAPSQVWNSPRFHAFNRKISAVFGLAFLVGSVSLIAAGSVDSRQFVLRLMVPYGALLMALLYTQKQASQVTEEVASVR